MRPVWIAAIAAGFAFSCWAQEGPQYSRAPDLLIADPVHYTLEFENQWARVIREHMPPHEGVKFHTHPDPGGLVVSLTHQNLRQTQADGTVRVLTNGQPGRIGWAGGRTHRGDNLMDTDYDYIEVEPRPQSNLAPAAPAKSQYPDPTVSDPTRYHVEFENDLVRAIRVRIAPHDHVAMHQHPATGAVLVLLTDQDARQTFPDGSMRENHYKAHTVRWEALGSGPHSDENLSDRPLEIVRVELKQSR